MTITTEDAEAFARQLENNEPGVSDPVAIEFFGDVATALRALAAERDRAEAAKNEAISQLSGISRELGVAEGKLAASEMAGVVQGWKERAEVAEARRDFLSARVDTLLAAGAGAELAMAALRDRAERAEAEAERLRAAFRVNALRWNPGMSHAEIDAEIERIALEGGDKPANEKTPDR